MNQDVLSILKVIQKEVWLRRRLVIALYLFTSLVFLVAAWVWPRVYTSSSTVFADQQNILQPLMAGTAVTTNVVDRAAIANKIIFSNKAVKRILEHEVWSERLASEQATAREIETFTEQLKWSTEIRNLGKNLIEITFRNSDPVRAYETARLMTDIFIQESLSNKQNESRSAYEFIDNQVTVYHEKLKAAENALKDFRSRNIDASSDAKNNANNRLIELKRELETIDIDISTEESTLEVLRKQLTGDVGFQNKASLDRERSLNTRLAAMEQRLEELKLNYHETYPDIVQIKSQIDNLKQQIVNEVKARSEASSAGIKEAPSGTIARNIRSDILRTETNISGLQTKRAQFVNLITKERNTLDGINAVEAEIAELTRDYTVNQTMYQNLLGQRENARVSMNIDLENQGLTLKVQEPATMPVTPKGLRFLHLVAAGLLAGFLVPVGIVYGLSILDQKVRTEISVNQVFSIPVLASVYTAVSPEQRKQNFWKFSAMVSAVVLVWSIYGYAIYMKVQG